MKVTGMAKLIETNLSTFLNPSVEPYPAPSPFHTDVQSAESLEAESRHGFLQNCWARALRTGSYTSVNSLLNGRLEGWAKISPNFSPTEGGINPITYIAQNDDQPSQYLNQRLTAHALIAAGVELRVPDARQLLPADYALMSANVELAATVVLATIEQFENRKGGDPYKPNIMTFFASEAASFDFDKAEGNAFDERARLNAFANLRRNHAVISDIIRDRARNHKDMTIRGMDDAQLGYWLKPLTHAGQRLTYGRLPRPPFEVEELHGLIRAEATAPRVHTPNALSAKADWDIERHTIERYSLLQAKAARDYNQSAPAPVF